MLTGFFAFLRKQGVVGLAVGFILGGAVAKLVTAFITDVVNPLLGLALGTVGGLQEASSTVGSAVILWGDLVSVAIDFIIVALVVYLGVHFLKLDRMDRKD